MKTIKDMDPQAMQEAILGALIAHGDSVQNPTARRFLAMQKRMEEEGRPKVVPRKLKS